MRMLWGGLIVVLLIGSSFACGSESTETGPSSTATPTSAPSPQFTATAPATTATSGISPVDASATASGPDGTYSGGAVSSLSLGQEAEVGDWRVKVVDVVLNADEIVYNHSEFNEVPQPGEQYVLVKIAAERIGVEASAFWADTTCVFVGGGGETFEIGWADVPEAMAETGDVAPGASVSGNLVFLVPSDQVSAGTLGLNAASSLKRLYFALD
jgi:hypothetical protein